ncbi:hypothetical protein EYF80_042619 [Liparis tanakae]|uniref:Uncharacterized protein n=1 Tax=Liparis tanakae TaxID=230148 RepID=A0A4Z2G2V8_9TELE|nr:hypothetical protein EYF80_042619 [Liparis tanakae]
MSSVPSVELRTCPKLPLMLFGLLSVRSARLKEPI